VSKDQDDLDPNEILAEIRGLASMIFVQDNGEIEAMMQARDTDGEEVRLIRSTFVDMFDFGVAYGVSATIEVMQRLGVIPRIHPDTEENKE